MTKRKMITRSDHTPLSEAEELMDEINCLRLELAAATKESLKEKQQMSPSLRDAIKAEKERLDAEEAQKPKGKPKKP